MLDAVPQGVSFAESSHWITSRLVMRYSRKGQWPVRAMLSRLEALGVVEKHAGKPIRWSR